MSKFSDLGKAIKQFNPEYRGQSDEALGRAEVERLRGMSGLYRNLETGKLIKARIQELYAREDNEEKTKPTHLQKQLEHIKRLEDPENGMIGTFFDRKNLEGKNKRQTEANLYRRQVKESLDTQIEIETNEIALGQLPGRLERVEEQNQAEHQLYLLQTANVAIITNEANANKIDGSTYLALAAKKKDNELTLAQKIELDKIELDRRQKEIDQDLRAGFVYQMQMYQHLSLMTEYIGGLYEQVKLAGDDRTRNLLEEHITFMEAQFRGKQGLLSAANEQDIQGSESDTDSPGDPR